MSITLPAAFAARMQALLGERYAAFLKAWEQQPLRRGLRVNTLKISKEALLAQMGDMLSPTPFSPDGFYLLGELRAGADPLHHAGAYYMQEPSAMSAVTALAPQAGERVLDLCAAPGGKSTQIAAALGGRGLLWCNEYVRSRASVLMQNLERCGVKNAAVSSSETGPLCEALAEQFDAVLCDAPCSGEGMFRKEPAALEQWSEENVQLCAARQREILSAAAKAVRPGGRLLYSTCTFATEENEQNAAWFLQNHPEFIAGDLTHLPFGEPAFDVAQFPPAAGRRILPDQGGEGHFLALFMKKGEAAPFADSAVSKKSDHHAAEAEALWQSLFLEPPRGWFCTVGDTVRLLPPEMPKNYPRVLSAGVAVAEVRKNRLEPAHSIFAAVRAEQCRQAVELPPGSPQLAAFLRGETVPCDPALSGWCAVTVCGSGVGFGKVVNGTLKNRYPKGLRLL